VKHEITVSTEAVKRARQEADVELFLRTLATAIEQHKNRSRLWWMKAIAVEWLRQRFTRKEKRFGIDC
jgi:hypothetical protein